MSMTSAIHLVSRRVLRCATLFSLVAVVHGGEELKKVITPKRTERSTTPRTTAAPSRRTAPLPTPSYSVQRGPYLQLVGPTGLRFDHRTGPFRRNPPLLPTPKPAEPSATEPALPTDGSADEKAFDLDLNGSGGTDQGSGKTDEGSAKRSEPSAPMPSALAPLVTPEEDLSDAIIYFSVPSQAAEAQGAMAIPVPANSPAGKPQPESRATYRVVK